MVGKLDSPIQSLLALSLPAEILPACFNSQHRQKLNTTWASNNTQWSTRVGRSVGSAVGRGLGLYLLQRTGVITWA